MKDHRIDRLFCWLFGHVWAVYSKYGSDVDDYMYCSRCGEIEDYSE